MEPDGSRLSPEDSRLIAPRCSFFHVTSGDAVAIISPPNLFQVDGTGGTALGGEKQVLESVTRVVRDESVSRGGRRLLDVLLADKPKSR